MYALVIVLMAYAIWVGWNDHNKNNKGNRLMSA